MKKKKCQQYFHCFIACILGPYAFWFNIVTILISSLFRNAALVRREALFSIWIPKGAALVKSRPLIEAWRVLEQIRYTGVKG